MPLASPLSHETLEFAAAGDWSCSHLAWLPPTASIEREALRESMRRGILRIGKGALRERALALLARERLEAEAVPPWLFRHHAARLRIFAQGQPSLFDQPGHLLEIVAPGLLTSDTWPLWISLAAALGIAEASGGRVLEPACLRELDLSMLDGPTPAKPQSAQRSPAKPQPAQRSPAKPQIVLSEHFMVLSGAIDDERGRMVTLGLLRLGMPELIVDDVPLETLVGFGSIVNGIAWHLFDRVLATPVRQRERLVRMPAELLVQPAWREAALGRCSTHVERFRHGEPGAPPLVRLEVDDGEGAGALHLGPGRSWTRGRHAWARALLARSGLAVGPPPLHSCCPSDGQGRGGWDG